MSLTRKEFLQALGAIGGLPWMSGVVSAQTPARDPNPPEVELPPVDPSLLKRQAGARFPVVESDDPTERLLIRALRLGEPVDFVYYGGSEPGGRRQVHPVMLFRVAEYPGTYLTGFCERRKATRTFRVDRMRLDEGQRQA